MERSVIQKILRHVKLAVDPPPIAPAQQVAFAWDFSSPWCSPRAHVRPLLSVFLRLVPRALRLCEHRHPFEVATPLAADDLPAPSCICDASLKTNRLTLGRLVCSKVVWSSPGAWRPAAPQGRAARGRRAGAGAKRRRRVGEKGL